MQATSQPDICAQYPTGMVRSGYGHVWQAREGTRGAAVYVAGSIGGIVVLATSHEDMGRVNLDHAVTIQRCWEGRRDVPGIVSQYLSRG